jgi:hypothetical protein
MLSRGVSVPSTESRCTPDIIVVVFLRWFGGHCGVGLQLVAFCATLGSFGSLRAQGLRQHCLKLLPGCSRMKAPGVPKTTSTQLCDTQLCRWVRPAVRCSLNGKQQNKSHGTRVTRTHLGV